MTSDFLSDDDKALFREQMQSVTPLHEKTKRVTLKTTKPAIPAKKTTHAEQEEKKEYYLSDIIVEEVLSHTILSYCQSSLTQQRFKALKNGKIPWEARLDLHGLRADQAGDALCQFIHNHSVHCKRCLLIIHGKGGQQNSPPIIKNLVNRWLPQLPEVLAFYSALPKDGGTGAVYVLLKRQR